MKQCISAILFSAVYKRSAMTFEKVRELFRSYMADQLLRDTDEHLANEKKQHQLLYNRVVHKCIF